MFMNVGPVILPNINTKGTSKIYMYITTAYHSYMYTMSCQGDVVQSVFSPPYIRHVCPTSLHYRIFFDVGIGRINP